VINIPLPIKELVPGYRAKWRARYACFLSEIAKLAPRLTYGEDQGTPWVEIEGGPRLLGYRTEPANKEVHYLLRSDLPGDIPLSHFRLVKDCLNRYLYPHMRPDLKPEGFAAEAMFGFHGQHKDAIADISDAALRDKLNSSFKPGPDDIILDCGAFLGFGDLRLADDISEGHVYAIEADKDCFALLQRNIAANKVGNITALHRAIWNEETELKLESAFAQANSLVSEVQKGNYTQNVTTITVDGAVAHFGLEKLDMLSLTLNGAEVEALDGAKHTLRDLRPRIRLAGWYSRQDRKISSITKEMLEPFGYQVIVGARGNVMALPE
jgi:FkbM family methyltransferase